MNLIILEPNEVHDDGGVTLTGARAAHLINVLKVTTGQRVQVGVLDGPRGIGEVLEAGDGVVALRCELRDELLRPCRESICCSRCRARR